MKRLNEQLEALKTRGSYIPDFDIQRNSELLVRDVFVTANPLPAKCEASAGRRLYRPWAGAPRAFFCTLCPKQPRAVVYWLHDFSHEGIAPMRHLLGIGAALAFVLPSHSHDIYSGLRDSAGRLCCGDQDCERVEDVTVHPDASVTLFSRRWQAHIRVEPDRIIWLAVGAGPATWCGNLNYEDPAAAPGPVGEAHIVTFCAFVDPTGS